MRLYSDEHLQRIGLREWAYKHLDTVPFDSIYTKDSAHTYFVPTVEFEEMVKQHNVIAALKGKKICKCVYKRTYFSHHRQTLLIST